MVSNSKDFFPIINNTTKILGRDSYTINFDRDPQELSVTFESLLLDTPLSSYGYAM